jgi:hypothetical protein
MAGYAMETTRIARATIAAAEEEGRSQKTFLETFFVLCDWPKIAASTG